MSKRQQERYDNWKRVKENSRPDAFQMYDLYYRLHELVDEMELSIIDTNEKLMKDTLLNAAKICHDEYMAIEFGK